MLVCFLNNAGEYYDKTFFFRFNVLKFPSPHHHRPYIIKMTRNNNSKSDFYN